MTPTFDPQHRASGLRALLPVCRAAAGALALSVAGLAAAQSTDAWPQRPLQVVAPFSPGAATDQITRTVAQKLADNLGVAVVVENRTGAAGRIAAEAVIKSAPDGYTVLFGEPGGLAVAPAVYESTSFETLRDLIPVAQAAAMPMVLVAHPSLGVRNLDELVKAAKARELDYGTNGTGSVQHLTVETLNSRLGLKMQHIPYRGGANVLTDLVAGQIQLSLLTVPTAASYIQAGQIVPLAVLDTQRSAALPDVPTAGEQGVSGMDLPIWGGFFVPAGTPHAIVAKLSAEIEKALQDPSVRERLTAGGNAVVYRGPADFRALVAQDVARWPQVVKEAGVKAD
ncbi:tripartite tricarboxylate transporter substrate binding protein [Verticiella sediminum]|uniref:Tripartite tricarboxylate transporter substrate binding protein n=1 Tax=Verticiella sediminum TaxID=1247510 RepID=A0A556B1D0_9BURK|nr:tripartite tricarboxylate transporter substrate binding protein [Verticiella sediminum]TSH99001.1 tripartite tricarboxylate transporter substrate binding protein [Verticiella sediminum]